MKNRDLSRERSLLPLPSTSSLVGGWEFLRLLKLHLLIVTVDNPIARFGAEHHRLADGAQISLSKLVSHNTSCQSRSGPPPTYFLVNGSPWQFSVPSPPLVTMNSQPHEAQK